MHKDKLGSDLPIDPSSVYSNAGIYYADRQEYWFRVSAYNNDWETEMSEAFISTIPLEIDHNELTEDETAELANIEETEASSDYLDSLISEDPVLRRCI
ncbi:hypothetical protein [Robertmurraya kyonggiensis]|uniref:Uncharacterized protein n=1 Tax=Robertmurraya kyonggiensis TaxID=1037680 RepID=A0A4U1CYV0_9BACI|nr:hypothetical protein [Robertmurraya kyonggiensis]TKC14954.1 hypothetical protein FA727_20845 [Robertmurraya kyonggiensis]